MSNHNRPIGELFDLLTKDMNTADVKKSLVLSSVSFEITKQRIKLGMNQTQFAKYLGVTQGMISKWENGDYNFTLNTLTDVMCKLGVDFDIQFKEKESSIRYFFDPGVCSAVSTEPPMQDSNDEMEGVA